MKAPATQGASRVLEYIHMPLKKYKYKNTNPCDVKSVDSSQPKYYPEEVGKREEKRVKKMEEIEENPSRLYKRNGTCWRKEITIRVSFK